MPGYSDKELPYAIPVAQALLEQPKFFNWLIAGTRLATEFANATPIAELQASMRGKTKAPFWFNYWCGKDTRCECRIGTGVETDIFLVLANAAGRRIGLHIEVKQPGDGLRNGQAESYPRRAACWSAPTTRPKRIPEHDDYLTILVAGAEIAADQRHKHFDKLVTHTDLASVLPQYPASA